MLTDKNSVLFTGTGLLFTDENGEGFLVNCHNHLRSEYDKVLYSRGIKKLGCKKKLSDDDKERIIAKIIELTPQIKWLIIGPE